ncbi:hypothetical protein [Pseudomonas mandelii]|uniref:Uncharacterized protein n=1 Tax=Pseudomonas mandelii TaxID=75612 RepID=A0A502HFS2_9PSED|nr:hypothetical protein [Pseudomonas mandelii]TPG73719.1 hypothetical protein EAH74_32620 [Pseudomonas mandelii]
MQLKKGHILVPALIGFVISLTFLIVQSRLFNLIGWNYNFCHALYGFTFPFVMSYLSFEFSKVQRTPLGPVMKQILSIPWYTWPLAFVRVLGRSIVRDFNEGICWIPLAGVAYVLAGSIGNEVFIDPATNGIPFTLAYENFVADVFGMSLFLLVTFPFVTRQKRARALLSSNA